MQSAWIFPFSLIIFSAIVAWAYIRYRFEKSEKQKGIALLANTDIITALPEYKKSAKRYHRLLIINGLIFVVALLSVTSLVARPLSAGGKLENYKNRDIMFCINPSHMDQQMRKDFYGAVINESREFHGQRIGITIFNDFAVRINPLSNDYAGLREQAQSLLDYPEEYAALVKDNAGRDNQPSKLGEGIVSCINNFDKLGEDKRSRSLLVLSNAEDSEDTRISLEQAAEYAKLSDIRLYAINSYDNSENDFEERRQQLHQHQEDSPELQFFEAATATGGDYFIKCYDFGKGSCSHDRNKLTQIIETITHEEHERGTGEALSARDDTPLRAAIVSLISVSAFIFLSWRLRI